MESGKKTNVILLTSVAAAATGVIALALIARWRERAAKSALATERLRDAQEVLSDCYRKIREIEAHLPAVLTADAPKRASHLTRRSMTNGSPAFDA